MAFKVKILTPTTGQCQMSYTVSLVKLMQYFAANRVYPESAGQWLDYDTIAGSGISANRERLIVEALKGDWTHFLFIDEDMYFDRRALHVLAGKRKPIVGCNYPIRMRDKGFTALTKDRIARILTGPHSSGLEPCLYTGFGFCLIERSIFERMKRPWFLIGYDMTNGKYSTEDAAFGVQLEEQLPDVTWYVDHDASKMVMHVGTYNYTWNETYQAILKEQMNGNSTGNLHSEVSVGEHP